MKTEKTIRNKLRELREERMRMMAASSQKINARIKMLLWVLGED